ncbi:MAG TPA: hypothetical protein ENK49_13775 [Gammaproteobacteria bacterium]|nr:hypothetical protein [Gammaproteobacteria bacterium]
MLTTRVVVLLFAGMLVACGSPEDNSTAQVKAGVDSKVPDSEKSGEGYFLRSVPDPCDRLDQVTAARLLGGDATVTPDSGGFGSAGGRCRYISGNGATRKGVGVDMSFLAQAILDTGSMSGSELEQKIAALYWKDEGENAATTSPDIGKKSFVFSNGKRTVLVVVTGIGGTAALSDRITSELVVAYAFMDPDRTPEAREAVLAELAAAQLAELDELARTTHQGEQG